ncbi:MAG: putative ATPase/ATPase/GTPase, AAA15 family [Verrucomicrobia bacterium]|nr:MAG: putative ATPase/ATPase/GTPase, AAA15 family [Verrucomicrobiota bacterium]
MLTSLHIKNFKAWKDTGEVPLAPLTVIFGANSAGKSSLGHLLLALKQTALSSDRRRALHLGDQNTLIDLGTFEDCLHAHDLSQALAFDLKWALPEDIVVKNPLTGDKFNGSKMSLSVKLSANKSGQPEATAIRYVLGEDGESSLDTEFSRDSKGSYSLKSSRYGFTRTQGRIWPLDAPEKFYRISDTTRARFQNAGFLADFALSTEQMLTGLYFLGPLRDHPRRTYQWSGDTPEDVGSRGEFTIPAILAADAQNRKLNRGVKQRLQSFPEFIARWLKDLGIIDSFKVRAVAAGRKEYEVLIKTGPKSPEVKITDVGFGVSQVLPALVLPFYCPANSVVWMEQPEIHLHPQVQAQLADVFISAVQAREGNFARNVQLIVESHSEHFLNRLQRRIAEGSIKTEEVAIYFCRKTEGGTELEPLTVNMFGDIENWPENFFGDEMADLTARTVAAAEQRKSLSAK